MHLVAGGVLLPRQSLSERCGSDASRKPASFFLDGRGVIIDCCREAESCFGFNRSELAGQHISCFIPELAGVQIFDQGRINWRLAKSSHCGVPFRALDREGNVFESVLSFVEVIENGQMCTVRLIAQRI